MEWLKKHWYIALGGVAVAYYLYRKHQITLAAANAQAAQQNALDNQQAYLMAQNASMAGMGQGIGMPLSGGYSSTNAPTLGAAGATDPSALTNALSSIATANQTASNNQLLSGLTSMLGPNGGQVSLSNSANGQSVSVAPTTPTVDPIASYISAQANNYFKAPSTQAANAGFQNVLNYAVQNGGTAAQVAADLTKSTGVAYTAAQVQAYATQQGTTIH